MRERACEEEQEQEETDGRTRTDGPRTDGDGAAGGGRERRVKEDDVGGGAGVHAISPRRGNFASNSIFVMKRNCALLKRQAIPRLEVVTEEAARKVAQ